MPSLRQNYVRIGSQGEHALYPVTPEESRKLPFTYDSISPQAVREGYEEDCKLLGIPSAWNNDGCLPQSGVRTEQEY